MSDLAIRVSRSYDVLQSAVEVISNVCDKLVVYEHPDEGNVHCHMLAMGCTKGTDTLKNYLKRSCGTFLPTEWSFKTKANMDFIAYMSKGKYDPKFVNNVDNEVIVSYKAQGYDKKNMRMENGKILRPVKSVVKKTKRELVELMLSQLDVSDEWFTADVVKVVRKVLVQNGEVVGAYKVLDFVDTVFMYGKEAMFIDNICHMYARRFK